MAAIAVAIAMATAAVAGSYKRKERENQVMQNIAASLGEDEIAALAAYFATIQPKR
jgi:cytochrome c553